MKSTFSMFFIGYITKLLKVRGRAIDGCGSFGKGKK
jgi:hypothetical protein